MSEIKTLEVEVTHPDILDVDVDFGQTLTKIVAPDHYNGPFDIFPSDEDQIIPVKEKMPVEDICVKGAEGSLEITVNGTYSVVGKKNVMADVNPDLRPLSVSENGTYEPDGFDGYSYVIVNNPAQWTSKGLAEGAEPYGDIDLGDATKIVNIAFSDNPNITGIIGKQVTTVSSGVFRNCTSLKEVHLPRIPTVSQSCFQNCVSIKFLFLPSVTGINTYGFSSCTSLETLILSDCANLGRYVTAATNGDENLKTVVLGRDSGVRSSTAFFSGSPFASGGSGGDIYIPKALYDHLGDGSDLDYLSYAEWNTLNGYGTITWHPIEGSEYETYMPGGAKYEEEMALT